MPPLLTDDNLRLRSVEADEYVSAAAGWYQDPVVLDLSEEGASPYDEETVRRMFNGMSGKGEVYLIEVHRSQNWEPVGDAAILEDATPIVIGSSVNRSKGLGTRVLRLLIERARDRGLEDLTVSGILVRNTPSLRLYQHAGFVETGRHPDARGETMVEMKLFLKSAMDP